MKKKILMICTAFAPENRIGAVRVSKFAKYLINLGWDVTVISPPLGENVTKDETLMCDQLYKVKKIEIPYSTTFTNVLLKKRNTLLAKQSANEYLFKTDGSSKSLVKQSIMKNLHFVYSLIRDINWSRQVKKYLDKSSHINDYHYVFSSYPNTASHLIARYVLNNRIASKWIADFRDSMAYNTLNTWLQYQIMSIIQKSIIRKATIVTCVSDRLLLSLINDNYSNDSKYHYLSNGYDEDDLDFSKKDIKDNLTSNFKGILKIAYVGGLYGGKRDISAIFKTIKHLSDLKIIDLNKIKFFYAGKEFSVLNEQAQKYQLENILINLGYVSREISLSIQQQSDLIVVSSWNSEKEQGIITGKVYECFLLKKPTLAIINGTLANSELGKMITEAGLGFSYESILETPELSSQLENFIISVYNASACEKKYNLSLNLGYIEQFNYNNIVSKFVDIIQKP